MFLNIKGIFLKVGGMSTEVRGIALNLGGMLLFASPMHFTALGIPFWLAV
jgi:hypothetical protein